VTTNAKENVATAQWRELLLQEQQLFRRIARRTMPKLLICLLVAGSLIVIARSWDALVCEYIFAATIAVGSLLTFQSARSLYQLRQQMRIAQAVIRSCETVERP
jgi:hypothetical protein